MLIGISILLLSASFLVYNHPPKTWLQFFRDLGARRLAPPPKPDDQRPSDQAQDEPQGTAHDSHTAPVLSQSPPTSERAKERRPPASIQIPRFENTPPDADSDSPQTTPKASTFPAVPSFSVVSDDKTENDEEDEDNLPPPSFPAVNSAQRASGSAPREPPKLKPLPNQTASQLMPPPSRFVPPRPPQSSGLMPPPRLPASSIRGPSGPLPNRGPPVASSSGNSLGLPMTAPVKTPNPRQKVQLTPGHSPLDWAALVKSGSNLSGVPSLQRVTPSQLKAYNGRKNRQTGEITPAWSAYQGKVYNITPYLPYHPGGEGELRRAAGKDGEKLFNEVHPWVNWDNMLSECVVGILVPEHSATEESGEGSLEDMD